MKNNKQNQNSSELKNRPEQLSTKTAQGVGEGKNDSIFNFEERETNRRLPAAKVLSSLKRWMPYQHKLAKVSGTIVSIQFADAPIRRVRRELSEFGFSWNEKRMAWQHYGGKTYVAGHSQKGGNSRA